jgi:hypothetical protein
VTALLAIARKFFALFVDDGSLALALVAWCVAAGLILPRVIPAGEWDAAVFFGGCLAVLLINVAVAVRYYAAR